MQERSPQSVCLKISVSSNIIIFVSYYDVPVVAIVKLLKGYHSHVCKMSESLQHAPRVHLGSHDMAVACGFPYDDKRIMTLTRRLFLWRKKLQETL